MHCDLNPTEIFSMCQIYNLNMYVGPSLTKSILSIEAMDFRAITKFAEMLQDGRRYERQCSYSERGSVLTAADRRNKGY